MMGNEHPFSVGTLHSTPVMMGCGERSLLPDADAEETTPWNMELDGPLATNSSPLKELN